MFCHDGYVFVFKNANSGASLHRLTRRIFLDRFQAILSDLKKKISLQGVGRGSIPIYLCRPLTYTVVGRVGQIPIYLCRPLTYAVVASRRSHLLAVCWHLLAVCWQYFGCLPPKNRTSGDVYHINGKLSTSSIFLEGPQGLKSPRLMTF